jgi:LPS sulfotransferase NodH
MLVSRVQILAHTVPSREHSNPSPSDAILTFRPQTSSCSNQSGANLNSKPAMDRSKSPVFVMGCHRSGTNLLYDTLLSAGGFAVYRGFLPVYKILIPRFGKFDKLENRKRMMQTWLRSKGFRRSGLDADELTEKILAECKTGGDFMRIMMDEVARRQNAQRWAVYDPDNVLHVARIKRDIPEALFVHIIRDGRDIALSLNKMDGFKPFPWDRKSKSIRQTAVYWEWMVRTGQHYGRQIPADYIEVRYEELVSDPRRTLATLGQFFQHDLDYDRIQSAGLGRLSETNSSFREEGPEQTATPVNRWKERLSREDVAALEGLVGPCLRELGYDLTTPEPERRPSIRGRILRALYPELLSAKLWLKINTPVGKLANLSALELTDQASSEEMLLSKD